MQFMKSKQVGDLINVRVIRSGIWVHVCRIDAPDFRKQWGRKPQGAPPLAETPKNTTSREYRGYRPFFIFTT
jgi:hypothetical protein